MAAYGRDNRVPPIGAYGADDAPLRPPGMRACPAAAETGGGTAYAGDGASPGMDSAGNGAGAPPMDSAAGGGMDAEGDAMDFARLAESYQKAHEAGAGPGPQGAKPERQEGRGPAAHTYGGREAPQGASGLPALLSDLSPVLCAALAMAALKILSEGSMALARAGTGTPPALAAICSLAGPAICAIAAAVSLRTYRNWPCGRDSAVLVLSAICAAALLSPQAPLITHTDGISPVHAGWSAAAAMAACMAADWLVDRAGAGTAGTALVMPLPAMGIAALARQASSFLCGTGASSADLPMVLAISLLPSFFLAWDIMRNEGNGIAASALAAILAACGALLAWAVYVFALSANAMIAYAAEVFPVALLLLPCGPLVASCWLLRRSSARLWARIALAAAIVFLFCYGIKGTVGMIWKPHLHIY